MRVDIRGCARCHGDGHERLEFAAFTHPVKIYTGQKPMTHWATCPATGEPVLLAVVAVDDDPDPG